MRGKFQVGKPGDLRSSDPWFRDVHDAIEHAGKLHRTANPFGWETVAIWDDRSVYVYLFFDGEMFERR